MVLLLSAQDASLAGITKQLRVDYPDRALDWLDQLTWTAPENVELDKIDYEDSIFERVQGETAKVAAFAKKIEGGWRKPVILVKRPGMPLLKAIDGHTRLTAYKKLGKPAYAWIGTAKTAKGPWDGFHKMQLSMLSLQALELVRSFRVNLSDQLELSAKVSKASVNYREATDPQTCCHTCSMSSGPDDDRRCALVRGQIHGDDLCDRWEAREEANPLSMSAQTARLAETPAPYGKPGGPGLYGKKGNKHSDYFEQIVKAMMRNGKSKGEASAMAYGILRRWAKGGGKVHPEVRAAAIKALAEEKVKGAAARASHSNTVTGQLFEMSGTTAGASKIPRDPTGKFTSGKSTSSHAAPKLTGTQVAKLRGLQRQLKQLNSKITTSRLAIESDLKAAAALKKSQKSAKSTTSSAKSKASSSSKSSSGSTKSTSSKSSSSKTPSLAAARATLSGLLKQRKVLQQKIREVQRS